MNKSARETDRYKLALRGATTEQLAAADAAHRMREANERGAKIGAAIATGMAVMAAGAVAAYFAFDQLVKKAGDFQDLAEKTGDSAQNIASLAVAAGTAGIEMKDVAGLAIKLSKNLVGVDDDSAAAGAAIKALGLNLEDLKKMGAADRLEAIAKALNGFSDSAAKGDVAIALLGKAGADALPFLKELGQQGARQVILTNEQIAAADEYADSQARMRSELSLHAQAIATDLLPVITEFKQALIDIASDQDHAATISGTLKTALEGLIEVFKGLALFGSDVAFTFGAVGRELGGLAAQADALGVKFTDMAQGPGGIARAMIKGAFSGEASLTKFSAISDAMKKDGEKARAELDKFQARISAIGEGKPAPASDNNYIETADTVRRPKLVFNGAPDKAKKDESAKLAQAQLNLDIANIKKAGEARVEAYSNAERIMQAMRSAGLVDDGNYCAAKLGFIRINSAAQEAELQAEIERLKSDSAIGKHKIDNQKKIVEAEGKIAKLRADAVTAITTNGIEEEAANRRVAQSYVDATKAAEQYIATIKKQAARDIGGVGKGEKFRQDQTARGQMTDSRDTKVEGLDTSLRNNKITQDQYDKYLQIVTDTYAQEVTAYEERTAAIEAAQGDWLNGASEAWENYKTKAQDVAGASSQAFTAAFDGMTDGISNSIAHSIRSGESLKDALGNVALNIAENFIAAFIKIGIQKLLVDKAASTLFAGTIVAQSEAMVAMAGLNAFASTAAIPIVGPGLAFEAATAATGVAEGFALAAQAAAMLSVASAANGFDIPAGVNPLTQLHEKEMVLPAQHADTIRRLGKNGGGGETAGAMPAIVQNLTLHIDSRSDQAQIRQMVTGAVKQGNAELVDRLQRAGKI